MSDETDRSVRLNQVHEAPHRLETRQGDLHEEFAYQAERVGVRRAQWRYWRDVLGFLRFYVIKRNPQCVFKPNTYRHDLE